MWRINPYFKYLKPEDHLHVQVCSYISAQYVSAKIHHSPNEGKRSKFMQFLLKLLRVAAGFPDLIIIYKGKLIVIELKVAPNKATKFQLDWIAAFNSCGIPAKVCTGYDESVSFIDENLKNLKKSLSWRSTG